MGNKKSEDLFLCRSFNNVITWSGCKNIFKNDDTEIKNIYFTWEGYFYF